LRSFAPTAHLVGFEFSSVLKTAPMRVCIVNSTIISLSIFFTIVCVLAVTTTDTYRSDLVVDVTGAFALGWTAPIAEGVIAASVAVGVASGSGDAVTTKIFESFTKVTATGTRTWARSSSGAPKQVFFRHV